MNLHTFHRWLVKCRVYPYDAILLCRRSFGCPSVGQVSTKITAEHHMEPQNHWVGIRKVVETTGDIPRFGIV